MDRPWDELYEALEISRAPAADGTAQESNRALISLDDGNNSRDDGRNNRALLAETRAYNQALKKTLPKQQENFHKADVLLGPVPKFALKYFPATKDFRRRVCAYSAIYGNMSPGTNRAGKRQPLLGPIVSIEVYADQILSYVWKHGGRFLCLNDNSRAATPHEPSNPEVHIIHTRMARQLVMDALTLDTTQKDQRRMMKKKRGAKGKQSKSAIKAAVVASVVEKPRALGNDAGQTKVKSSESKPKALQRRHLRKSLCRRRSTPDDISGDSSTI